MTSLKVFSSRLILFLILVAQSSFGLQINNHLRYTETSGSDVTLTCPVTLQHDEEYDSVTWAKRWPGRYDGSDRAAFWNKQYHFVDMVAGPRVSLTLPSNNTQQVGYHIANIACDHDGLYSCNVVGSKGTNEWVTIDLFINHPAASSLELTQSPASVPYDQEVTFTCTDVSGSSGGYFRWYLLLHQAPAPYIEELPSQSTFTYDPRTCSMNATSTASASNSWRDFTFSVTCELIHPSGTSIGTSAAVHIDRQP